MKHREAFTLTEALTACLIMTIMLSVAAMSPKAVKQTAKREAEKLQAYLYRTMQKADRIHKNFYLEIYSDFVRINWHDMHTIDDSFKSSDGCRYSNNFSYSEAKYNAHKKLFSQGGTITVYDADGEKWYVILAGITEGRVRTSSIPPD